MSISKTRIDGWLRGSWGTWYQVPRVTYPVSSLRQAAATVAQSLLCLGLLGLSSAYGQETPGQEIQSPEKAHAQVCQQTSGSHGFRRLGETIDIPVIVGDCQPIAFILRWSNGRNNGSSLVITFLDSMNQPIYSQGLSGFLTGTFEFPFASLDMQPWFARGSMVAVPATIVIQTQQPFAPPANISYTVTRRGARARPPREEVQPEPAPKSQPVSARASVLDEQIAMRLRTAQGRLLSEGQGSWASGSPTLVRYKLKELALPEPREMEIHGRREKVEFAYRLTLAEGELRSSQRVGTPRVPALSKVGLIWLDDAALPVFSLDSQEISALIYDPSILKEGAEIAVSSADGSDMYSLVERLRIQSKILSPLSSVKTNYESNTQASTISLRSSREGEPGNEVVGIRSAIRVVGAMRMPLVQIQLRTNRPFPPRDSALQLQIGKRFFLNELTGDHTGRTLTLTITQEMFAELKQGAEIVAFFDKPDRSGFAGRDVWHFGRLDKGSRQ